MFGLLSSGQLYYAREMTVVLIMLSVVFVSVAVLASIVFALGRAGQGTLVWAEKKCGLERRTPVESLSKNRFEPDLAPAGLEFIEVKNATLPKTVSREDQSVFDPGGDA